MKGISMGEGWSCDRVCFLECHDEGGGVLKRHGRREGKRERARAERMLGDDGDERVGLKVN